MKKYYTIAVLFLVVIIAGCGQKRLPPPYPQAPDPAEPAVRLLAQIRAFNPRPGAHASWNGERVKIWEGRAAEGRILGGEPGILQLRDDRVVMQTGTGLIELVVIQPPGKGPMAATDWARGRRDGLGAMS